MGLARAYLVYRVLTLKWRHIRAVFSWSGILLLEELVAVFEMDGLRLIVEAVQQRLIEASQAKAQGRTDWWKVSILYFITSSH